MWPLITPYLRIATAAALVALAFYHQHIRDKAQKYDAAVEQLAQERGQFAAWKVQQRRNAEASQRYQDELRTLRADLAALPAPVVRVCPPAKERTAATVTTPTGPIAQPAAAGGVQSGAAVSGGQGIDIGPGLKAMSARADELSAQLRAIIQRN